VIGTVRISFEVGSSKSVPEISAIQYAKDIQTNGAEGYMVFVNEILTERPAGEVDSEIQKLLTEYSNCFPTLLPRVKFANLPPGLPPDRGQHNHSIPLQNETSKPHFQQ
jgi:hypothetical protein